MLMKSVGAALAILLAGCSTPDDAKLPISALDDRSPISFEYWPDKDPPMSEDGQARIKSFLEDNGSSSFFVLYKGKVAFEYGDIHKKHLIHSMRKPILSLLYGKAIADGDVDLDETLATLGLEEPATAFSSMESAATVRQLLQSRSGVYLPAAAEAEEMASSRPERGSHRPGEAYYYNNWSFNSLGTLYENRTGQSIYEAFQAQLARPLGMADYRNDIGSFTVAGTQDEALQFAGLDGFYLTETDKSRHAAYHFRLSTHDLALIGQMLADGGVWEGQEIIDPDWLDQTTKCDSVLIEDIGGGRSLCYGMMWRVIQSDGLSSAFMHTGVGVHMIYVHPGAELVLIHRADTENPDYEPAGDVRALIGLTFGALN